MERWTLMISGTGSHHSGQPGDAEQVAAAFVEELKKQGHSIDAAKFVASGQELALPEPEKKAEKKKLPVSGG